MKVLAFFCFFLCSYLPALAASPPLCQKQARKLLKTDFLSKALEELADIAKINHITITNVEVKNVFFRWDDDRKSPRIPDFFEVANVFGIKVSDFFQYADNLRDNIDPSKIIGDKPPLSKEHKHRIFQATSLHLSGLIGEILQKRNLSPEKLALETGISPQVFHGITVDKGLPRLNPLLQILPRLDADVVDFFRRVEIHLEQAQTFHFKKTEARIVPWDQGEIEDFSRDIFDKIHSDLARIFLNINLDNPTNDILRFKRMVRLYIHNAQSGMVTKKRLLVSKVLQMAHMLGINPSEVLKYAGNLESRVQWSGMESRTLLSKEEINILAKRVHQHLSAFIDTSEKTLEELSLATEMPLQYFKDFKLREYPPRISVMERILRATGKNCIVFFEEMESLDKIGISSGGLNALPVSPQNWSRNIEASNQFIGERIIQIREILSSVESLTKISLVTALYEKSTTARETRTNFTTLYKFSRVANITLSDLVSDRPIKTLVNPQHSEIKKVSNEDIKKARQLLTHLLLSEARRQKDVRGLTVTELAIKAHLFPSVIRTFFLGKVTPSYPVLRQIVENGLGISLEKFLYDFEKKLEVFDSIPFVKPQVLLAELRGPYLSPKIQVRLNHVQNRVALAREFLKSLNTPLTETRKLVGDFIFPVRKRASVGHNQIHTSIKFSHFLGISMQDFLGQKSFAELVDVDRLNFEILPNENIRQVMAEIKKRIDQRRESLGLSIQDFRIMLAENSHARGVFSFSWAKYFQISEILARDGEDDLFLLDGI